MGCACAKFGSNGDITQVVEDIREKYAISNELLGRGSFGQVRTVVEFKTGLVCAVKIIQRDNKVGEWSNEAMFKTEVELIRNLDHTNIIKFYEVYEDPRFLYVVMEKCVGGEVFDKIRELRRFGEWDASNIGRQMLCGLHYIHDLNIIHRDVKAENFLFLTKDMSAPLRLIDFGMATRIVPGEYFTSLCGSPHYLSPELVGQRYQESTDLWSFGVLMYLMLFGRYPFDGNSPEEIMRNILTGVVNWTHTHVQLSPLAIQFLKRFLVLDATKRITAKQALVHDWICTRKPDMKTAVLPQEVRAAAHSASKIRFNQNMISSVQEFQQKLSEAENDYSRGKVGVRIVSHEEKRQMRTSSVVHAPKALESSSRRHTQQVEKDTFKVSVARLSLPIARRMSNFMTGQAKKVHTVPIVVPTCASNGSNSESIRNNAAPASAELKGPHSSTLASSPSISATSNAHAQSVISRKSYASDGSTRSVFLKTPATGMSGADDATGGMSVMSGCNALAPFGPPSPRATHVAPPSSPMPGEQSPMSVLLGSLPHDALDDDVTFGNALEERLRAKCERPLSPTNRDGDNDSVSSSTVGTESRPCPATMNPAPIALPSSTALMSATSTRTAPPDWLVDTPVIEEDESAPCIDWSNGCSKLQPRPSCAGKMTITGSVESLVRSPTVGPAVPANAFDGAPGTSEAHNSPVLFDVCPTPSNALPQNHRRGGSVQITDRHGSKSTVRRFSHAIQHIFSSSNDNSRATRASISGAHRSRTSNRVQSHLVEYLGGISENDIQEFAAEYARKVDGLESEHRGA